MDKYYYLDGITLDYYDRKRTLHRLDGPALIDNYNNQEWYKNGLLHRLGGPAIEYYDGTKIWYKNGKLHRLDGPACERTRGKKYWFIDGKKLTKKQFKKTILIMKLSGLLNE